MLHTYGLRPAPAGGSKAPLPIILTPETILIGGCFFSATCDLWLVRQKHRLYPGFTPQLTGPEV